MLVLSKRVLLVFWSCVLAAADDSWLKDTVWLWNNWREVTFHGDGRFEAPEPNCQSRGCTWKYQVSWSGVESIVIDWKSAGRHTVSPNGNKKVISGTRFDGDKCSATFVRKMKAAPKKSPAVGASADGTCSADGVLPEACTPAYDLESEDYDPYAVLGVDADVSDGAIKKAFRKLSVKYHPDRNPGEGAAIMFGHIRKAMDVVGDKDQRMLFDMGGMEMVKKGKEQAQQGNAHNPLAAFFGGGQQQQGSRGPDASISLSVLLDDLYNGKQVEQGVARRVICRGCKNKPAKGKCAGCGRCPNEIRTEMRTVGPGFQVQQQVEVPSEQRCKQAEVKLDVVIEKGMDQNSEIRFERMSEQKPGHIPGDILVKLQVKPHKQFKRVGNDLHTDMKITLKEALLGFTRQITHMDGHLVEVTQKKVTKPNEVRKIKKEGMPLHGTPSEHGTLHVKFVIQMPSKLTDAQRAAVEEHF